MSPRLQTFLVLHIIIYQFGRIFKHHLFWKCDSYTSLPLLQHTHTHTHIMVLALYCVLGESFLTSLSRKRVNSNLYGAAIAPLEANVVKLS